MVGNLLTTVHFDKYFAMPPKTVKSDDEWKKQLTEQEFEVTRKKGTERAFTGRYWDCHEDGTYTCVCCGATLFTSDTKYDSGSGWPSFTTPAEGGAVETEQDRSHGMVRTEVHCSQCGAHLGHVFDDGPRGERDGDTKAGPKGSCGLRYCINSASLKLDPTKV